MIWFELQEFFWIEVLKFDLTNNFELILCSCDDTATRWKAHFSFLSVDGDDNDDMTFGLMYGKEKHHDGSTRLATYQGWEGGLLYSDINGNDATAISGGVFVGANYYIANNLYIGTEINFSVALGEETIAMGPGVKGMLTLGWKM